MRQIIKVNSGFTLNTHDTFDASIDATKNVREKMKSKCSIINGKVVTDYHFNGHELVISYENKHYLSVSPGESLIKWDVVSSKPDVNNLNKKDIVFELSNGHQFDWNCEKVLDGFMGKKMSVSPSDQLLFIFSEDRIEYMFDYYIDINDSNKKYLTISEA